MAEPIVNVKNLSVIYNQGKSNEVRSLDGVDLKIFPQEYIIIYGPSGCGKSTLLYTIAGLQPPTRGEVRVEEKDLSKIKKKEMVELHQKGIGLVFQAFYLVSSINVLDNVCLPKVFRGEDKIRRKNDGMKLLQRFGIAEQRNKFPGELSGGQKQRVAIARSLVNNPGIILADEPVGNLDSESAENVMKILRELNEVDKKTVILVTHSPEHLHFADRVIHMKDGKIISEEVNRDKRPKETIKEEMTKEPEAVSNELKLLMRVFKNFSPEQLGALLLPYKAKQLITHILSEFTEEQINSAEIFLRDFLFNNIGIRDLEKNLDLDFDEGGANWNKIRAKTFSARVEGIMEQANNIAKDAQRALPFFAEYLINIFHVKIDTEAKSRLTSFLKLRIENRIDFNGLQDRLDAPLYLGGVGLYKTTADKMVREIEIIMLMKYAAQ